MPLLAEQPRGQRGVHGGRRRGARRQLPDPAPDPPGAAPLGLYAGRLCLVAAASAVRARRHAGLLGGMVVRVFGVACLNITLSLYIMDNIQRGDFVRSEPLRLTMSAGAWTFCPSLGVFLYGRFGAARGRWPERRRGSCCSRPSGRSAWATTRRSPPGVGPPPNPLRQHRPLPRPAAAAARLADRLRALGLVGPVLHLRAALHGERGHGELAAALRDLARQRHAVPEPRDRPVRRALRGPPVIVAAFCWPA